MMKLKNNQQLEFYENCFHEKDMILLIVQSIYRTLERNMLSQVYLVKATNLSVFCYRKITL